MNLTVVLLLEEDRSPSFQEVTQEHSLVHFSCEDQEQVFDLSIPYWFLLSVAFYMTLCSVSQVSGICAVVGELELDDF